MRIVWQKGIIPKAWRRAGGVLIPKEKDAADVNQFRPICLPGEEQICGHIHVWSSGCLEHISMIWHQIQEAKKEKRDLHVTFLNLANAFGSVPHNLLWESFKFFHVPSSSMKAYCEDLQLCFSLKNVRFYIADDPIPTVSEQPTQQLNNSRTWTR